MSVVVEQVKFDYDNNWLIIEEQFYPELTGCVKCVKSRMNNLSKELLPCPVTTP